ncbi:hypothetical protein K701_27150 [Streptomyces fradiae ATCC 10745 = DSM 40063]|uniref:Secreted protein n=1 Tax=Streptomyces fradiae ATCC 10745 = DSM 40063 TaxID=1319510 RepID=A0ABQ6XLL7_STRFR|nr:hypothetical protein K701_27150 [Streptomyces fradiae ATCC 10745 = DSM 40063]
MSAGQRRWVATVTAAISVPSDSAPVATPYPPYPIIATIARSGSAVMTHHRAAVYESLRSSRTRSRRACPVKRRTVSGARPNTFSTRTPSTDSSTVVDRSPPTSCAARATTRNRCSKTVVATTIGVYARNTTSASAGASHARTTRPTASAATFTTR